ncbi:MAG: hypothetical protein EOO11_11525 [Chitinophagaceae bacterium]|nr:MAG: hypothetical protein EOO11_11525 [Chitinophagaceae bacterium]
MTEEQRARMRAMQHRIKMREKIRDVARGLRWRVPAVLRAGVPWRYEYFRCVPEADRPYWEEFFPLLEGLGASPADIKTAPKHYVHQALYEQYPGVLPLRFLPDLPFERNHVGDPAEVLPGAMKDLGLTGDEEIFFFWSNESPVFRLRLGDVPAIDEYQQVTATENLCLLATDYSWLIFRSLEEEWRWGFRPSLT